MTDDALNREYLSDTERALLDKVQSLEQRETIRQLGTTVANYESEFAKDHSDYYDKVQEMQKGEVERLVKFHGFSEAQAQQQVTQGINNALVNWINQGVNPAAKAYALANEYGGKKSKGGSTSTAPYYDSRQVSDGPSPSQDLGDVLEQARNEALGKL